ncbi:hypothetical protein [Streptomyces sp.]|uniref:hypothetical protein n=1 Tax=Streptomyces sp. TaxID=1931 RepID=UPI00281243C8|nr:hypothetical protein [Streptomyces sp.]
MVVSSRICAVVPQPRHVPGEARHELDRGRRDLEVHQQLVLPSGDAGEVPQPLVGVVLLALDLRHALTHPEQRLVDHGGQLRHGVGPSAR